jgi:dihydropteroate synthase
MEPRDPHTLLPSRLAVMGVLNATPDSFSDGGRFLAEDAALAQGRRLVAEGADILDIGGESTRPDAAPVPLDEELRRVLPVIRALAPELEVPISVDTFKARTAEAALAAGARMVNDVRGLRADPDLARVCAEHEATVALMHFESHDIDPQADILARVRDGLARSLEIALRAGIDERRLLLDPGIGFGKSVAQNLALIRASGRFAAEFGRPVLIGASRKRMIVKLVGERAPQERLPATLALHVAAAMSGARAVRAHDVRAHRDALAMIDALETA